MIKHVHGEIILEIEKDSFKIQDSKDNKEISELVLSLEDAHRLYIELNMYFGSKQQKLEDLKGIWQEPSSQQFFSSPTSCHVNYQDPFYHY